VTDDAKDATAGERTQVEDVDESWPVVRSEDLHRDDWVMALRADYITSPSHPEGEPFRRLVLEHPGAAVVLAVDDDERVVCVAQYRHAAGRRLIELPAGLCDAHGEDPMEVAKRELREEVLLAAAEWTHLTSAYSSPGISSEVIHYYLARGLTEIDRGDFALVHEEADMEVFWVPFSDLVAAALDGRVSNAPVIVAVLTAQARGLVGARP
jgi:8-oxo-dGTP pyrophosphatase MutT (NUDIX family)